MDLTHATRRILAECATHPELMRVTRYTYDELAAGREVPHTTLADMLSEAGRKGVFSALKHKHGEDAVNAMVTVLAREIDRQAPVAARQTAGRDP